jgi:hypothetical protein
LLRNWKMHEYGVVNLHYFAPIRVNKFFNRPIWAYRKKPRVAGFYQRRVDNMGIQSMQRNTSNILPF